MGCAALSPSYVQGILSIQSQLAVGHVGNSAAVFALQRLGREVWPVPTVLLSHHPGHGGAQGGPVPLALQRAMIAGLASRGCFSRCAAVISGYLGQAGVAEIVRDAVAAARAGTPNTVYLCDPVLGDEGHTYVSPEVVTAVHNLAALADILSPNAYEVFLLTGRNPQTRADALQALRLLQSRGPRIVILTSFAGTETPANTLDVMAVDGAAAWRVSLPQIAAKFSGAGDVFSALFLNFWLNDRNTGTALGDACSALSGVLKETASRGAKELELIAAQNMLVKPDHFFVPERIA
jgi:pyridoxine kinase